MWAAARRQAQQLACALVARSSAGGLEALGGLTRGVHRLPKDESLAAKRERRKQRRKSNRDLKEQVDSYGWRCKPQTPAKAPAATRARPGRASRAAKHTSTASSDDEGSDLEEDWQLFQAMLGQPRSASEKRLFTKAWQQWQAACKHERAGVRSGMSAGGGSTWGWERAAAGGPSSSQGGASSSSGGSGGSGDSWKGRAGASAGPRWGQANWSWDDFRQEASSTGGGNAPRGSGQFSGWGFEEAWYEAAPGSRRGSSSSSSSHAGGSAWGWRNAWQEFGSSGGSSTGGNTGSGGSRVQSSRSHSSVRLLGLDATWLSLRCGRRLKQAYLVQAKALHPDMHAGSGCTHSAAAAEAKFKEVQAAYEELLTLVAHPAAAGQR